MAGAPRGVLAVTEEEEEEEKEGVAGRWTLGKMRSRDERMETCPFGSRPCPHIWQ